MRRALALAAAVVFALTALSACGGGGGGASTSAEEKEADVVVMNQILGRQMTVVGAYEELLPKLKGAGLALVEEFRAQEQEHVDATVKALRGLGAAAEPEEESIEPGTLRTQADTLRFLYEMESESIDSGLSEVAELNGTWPRMLLTSMVANQAQRLVLLRRALGVKPLDAIPSGFEDGATPAP